MMGMMGMKSRKGKGKGKGMMTAPTSAPFGISVGAPLIL